MVTDFVTLVLTLHYINNNFLKITTLAVGYLISIYTSATHIVGGEIYYSYLGNNIYEVTLSVYRDCGPANTQGTGFDPIASVGVYFTSSGELYDDSFTMDLASAEVSIMPIILENPCFILPPDVCVERAVYTNTVEIPDYPGGFTLVYQRCCRNPSIINLDFPQDQGATFTTHIPGSDEISTFNSSARFVNFPPVALCLNAEFYFDHHAVDEDGDSLSYEFCSPLLGGTPDNPAPFPSSPPYTGLNYANGFSSDYPITSDPAFAIDPVTGFITGTATELGQFVIGICVSEFRDGFLINSSNRDFQFNVTMCDPSIISSITNQDDFCIGQTTQFQNESINSSFFFWDFGVEGIDSDTSILTNPQFEYTESGNYVVMLIANPTWPCADTSYTSINALPIITPDIVVGAYECVDGHDLYDFSFTGNMSPSASFNWNFGSDSSPQSSTEPYPQNIMMNPEAIQMNVTLEVQENGCEESDAIFVTNPPNPISGIIPQNSFCDGFEYTFENTAENGESYFWNFGEPGFGDVSTLDIPTYTFQDTGYFQVMLIVSAPFTCSDTSYTDVQIYGYLDAEFESQDIECLDMNSYDFSAIGATTSSAQYSWNFGPAATPESSNLQNPQNVVYDLADTHVITLTISENGCSASYVDSLTVVDHFITNLSVNNSNGCAPLYVQMNGSAISDVPVFYLWDFGDGLSSQQGETSHIYENPGVYDVTITAFTLQGCVDSVTQTFPGVVVVHPDPIPGFTITPQTVTIFEPEVVIADSSYGAAECHYLMSDGGQVEGCDFNYSWTESGYQTITQYVTSEFGCTANVTGIVIVEGFMFFAPSSFTPNSDGLNDFWLPEMTGITYYKIKIFNRWGEPIFESVDPEKPWFGSVNEGDFHAQNGVYNYVVTVKDLIERSHEFTGHITLVR